MCKCIIQDCNEEIVIRSNYFQMIISISCAVKILRCTQNLWQLTTQSKIFQTAEQVFLLLVKSHQVGKQHSHNNQQHFNTSKENEDVHQYD